LETRSVAGFFYVSMEVRDQSGPTTTISKSTVSPHHVVIVENITTLPIDAHVFSLLPGGTSHIEFNNPTSSDNWDRVVANIPGGSTREVFCDVSRNGATNSLTVPIQCDEVLERRGSQPWKSTSSKNIPFDMAVLAC
jgi:hypothetical protein